MPRPTSRPHPSLHPSHHPAARRPPQSEPEAAAAEIRGWLGGEPGLVLHSLTLMAKGSAQDALFPRSTGQPTLQQLLVPEGGAAVVGGVAAGSGNLFFRPSSAQPRGSATSLSRPKIVGLALCSASAGASASKEEGEGEGEGGGAAAGPGQAEAAAAQPSSSGGGGGGGGGGSAPVRAAALSVHGFAAAPQDAVWHSLELVRKWGSTQAGVGAASQPLRCCCLWAVRRAAACHLAAACCLEQAWLAPAPACSALPPAPTLLPLQHLQPQTSHPPPPPPSLPPQCTQEEVALLESGVSCSPGQRLGLPAYVLEAGGSAVSLALWSAPADAPVRDFSSVAEAGGWPL